MRAIVKWSPAEEARLRFLHDRGATSVEIAATMGRGLGSIKAHLGDMLDDGAIQPRRLTAKHFDAQDNLIATREHLKDILLAHGYEKRWASRPFMRRAA